MALKNWIIDLRVDFDSKRKEAIAEKLVRSHAKALLTEIQLIADKRKPDIAIQSDDMFVGREEISLFNEEDIEQYGITEGATTDEA
jgi:hypothetical protein